MPYNIDKKSIETGLRDICESYKREDGGFADLAQIALLNVLQNELSQQDRPDNLKQITADDLNETTPMWLTNAFNEGKAVYRFEPDAYLKDEIFYILGWIEQAIDQRAPWIEDVDEKFRPKKLLKLGTLAQAKAEADKALEIAAQKAAETTPEDTVHEHTVMVFDDGFRIVKMRTPYALAYETQHMRHCVGQGDYGHLDKVEDGSHAYYSLRDPYNKGHVTMQVFPRQHLLKECKGKQNQIPVAKYMPYIQAFFKEQAFSLSVKASQTGLIEQDGEYYDINNLPENFHYKGNLNLSDALIRLLPKGLRVDGSLFLEDSAIEALPEGLHVTGSLNIAHTKISSLPDDMEVGEDLYINGSDVSSLPDGLRVTGTFCMRDTVIESLPENLVVIGNLDAQRSRLKALPDGLKVSGNIDAKETLITSLPDNFEVNGDLNLGNTPLAFLPKGLKVAKTLHLNSTNIADIPDDLEVGGSLYLQRTKVKTISSAVKVGENLEMSYCPIESLPDDFTVNGDLKLNESAIKVLPRGLRVEGDLDLHRCKVASLPSGLFVGDELDIMYTDIDYLPDDLVVEGVVTFATLVGSVGLDEARSLMNEEDGSVSNGSSSPRPPSPGM